MNISPESIFAEYEQARRFKGSIGTRGLYEQNRMNERFYVGDQWHGAACGGDRPLVRHNIIKRIGDYKISQLAGNPLAVNYFAEGFSQNNEVRESVLKQRRNLSQNSNTVFSSLKSENEIGLMISVLDSYRDTVASRVKFDGVIDQALRDAYIRGTGVVYTYFDPDIKTGLYADRFGGTPILGDIVCENLKIENVYFADPTICELQKQPYIILTEEKSRAEVWAEMIRFSAGKDDSGLKYGNPKDKITVYTKLYKEKDPTGKVKVFATRVTEKEIIRPPFCMGITVYPISIFAWERRDECIYGDSEITYIIPNQIAINRMITASVWSAMSSGMPLMVVNGDIVSGDITNEPGQIIKAYGTAEELNSAVKYVSPPDYSAGFNACVNNLIENTLTQCGANEASLGDLEAHNTSAIIELRDAASKYLIPLKNRYFAFIEDISLIWAEFFFAMYGKRCLKIADENGVWYFPFDASLYKDLVLTVSVRASDGVNKGEREQAQRLYELLDRGAITPAQYVERLPKETVPKEQSLLKELPKEGEV